MRVGVCLGKCECGKKTAKENSDCVFGVGISCFFIYFCFCCFCFNLFQFFHFWVVGLKGDKRWVLV